MHRQSVGERQTGIVASGNMHVELRDAIRETRRLILESHDNLRIQFDLLKLVWTRRTKPDRQDPGTFIFPLFLLNNIAPLSSLETLLRPPFLETHASQTPDQIYLVTALAQAWGFSQVSSAGLPPLRQEVWPSPSQVATTPTGTRYVV